MGTAEEREASGRSHHEAWRGSSLNQREYCEAHGLALKRFENRRVKFQDEPEVPRKCCTGAASAQDIYRIIWQFL
jgi:hypothetical protein